MSPPAAPDREGPAPAPIAIVLDASTTLAWCFDDESPRALALLDGAGATTFLVPSLWLSEVANGLVVAERRARIEARDAERFLTLLSALEVRVEAVELADLPRLAALARAHGLSAYDATYLHLALRLGAPLATLDERLTGAARTAGVPLALRDR